MVYQLVTYMTVYYQSHYHISHSHCGSDQSKELERFTDPTK
jgi:hypothetical protein